MDRDHDPRTGPLRVNEDHVGPGLTACDPPGAVQPAEQVSAGDAWCSGHCEHGTELPSSFAARNRLNQRTDAVTLAAMSRRPARSLLVGLLVVLAMMLHTTSVGAAPMAKNRVNGISLSAGACVSVFAVHSPNSTRGNLVAYDGAASGSTVINLRDPDGHGPVCTLGPDCGELSATASSGGGSMAAANAAARAPGASGANSRAYSSAARRPAPARATARTWATANNSGGGTAADQAASRAYAAAAVTAQQPRMDFFGYSGVTNVPVAGDYSNNGGGAPDTRGFGDGAWDSLVTSPLHFATTVGHDCTTWALSCLMDVGGAASAATNPGSLGQACANELSGSNKSYGAGQCLTSVAMTAAGAKGAGAFAGVGGVSETTSVFWSGGQAAKTAATEWASANGGRTIGMTKAGQNLATSTKNMDWSEAKPQWAAASQEFAAQASGRAVVFQSSSGVSVTSIWAETEYPTLVANPNVTGIDYLTVGVKP